MSKRTWIDSDIWSDTEDLTDDEKIAYLYLLTNDQRNIAGYYKLNIRHMAFDLGVTESRLLKTLTREQKYWKYDIETSQVLIPKFTRYNIVKSKQQIAAMNAELTKLKVCPLHKVFLESWIEINGIGSEDLIDEKIKYFL